MKSKLFFSILLALTSTINCNEDHEKLKIIKAIRTHGSEQEKAHASQISIMILERRSQFHSEVCSKITECRKGLAMHEGLINAYQELAAKGMVLQAMSEDEIKRMEKDICLFKGEVLGISPTEACPVLEMSYRELFCSKTLKLKIIDTMVTKVAKN